MTFAFEIDFVIEWQRGNWCAEVAPFDRWQWGRSENVFGNPVWSFGPVHVTRLADSA